MSKKDDLLVIKNDIEKEVEAHALPLATLQVIMEAFSDYILMDKTFRCIQKEVADWYSKYNFINVLINGYGVYTINYRG